MKKKNKKTILLGASQHAGPVLELVQLSQEYLPVGYLEKDNSLHGKILRGIPVLGGDELLFELQKQGVHAAALGLGYDFLAVRAKLFKQILELGFELPNFVHPFSWLAGNVEMGKGNVVMAGAVLNPGTILGDACVVNTKASVDHDCQVGSGSFISPGVSIGGSVSIGKDSFIGIGACVRDGIAIGNHVLVGAGAVVVKDLPDHVVAFGNPARVVRQHK